MTLLHVTGLSMPPSVNSLYFNMRGRRVLSAEGRALKNRLQADISRHAATVRDLETQRPLSLHISLYFERLENSGWSKGKAKNRYKRVDVTNRAKLLEDAVSAALGIDDSLFFEVILTKHLSPTGVNYAEIRIKEHDE